MALYSKSDYDMCEGFTNDTEDENKIEKFSSDPKKKKAQIIGIVVGCIVLVIIIIIIILIFVFYKKKFRFSGGNILKNEPFKFTNFEKNDKQPVTGGTSSFSFGKTTNNNIPANNNSVTNNNNEKLDQAKNLWSSMSM